MKPDSSILQKANTKVLVTNYQPDQMMINDLDKIQLIILGMFSIITQLDSTLGPINQCGVM